jgi:hypothetical protein
LEIKTRSVRIGTAVASANTSHIFTFTIPSANVLGSIAFEYCTNSPFYGFPCTAPAGLNVATASLASQNGNTGFAFDAVDTTANRLVINRTAAAGSAVASDYTFNGIANPSTAGQTVFVRIATYASTDATGSQTDNGAVAFAIVTPFRVDAFVPPYLTFCVGVTVSIDCSTATGNQVNFGELLHTQASSSSTQFSGATNDLTGYTTYLNGQTMTSGNNVITPLSSNAGSSPGIPQFGFNLRGNSNPTVGNDPNGIGTASATASYDVPDSFRFVDGEAIASSPIPTDFRRFTVSYIVNVPNGQAPGFYATTLTFTAVASF